MPGTVRFLSAGDMRHALPMKDAVDGMKRAYAQLSAGKAVTPLRGRVQSNGTTLVMPAYVGDTGDLAVKVVSVFPTNIERNLPTIFALVLVLDSATGQPLALMEGGSLTAIRTGAGGGAATDVLANADASIVAIIGSGVQAKTQLEAVCAVRDVQQVRVYSRTTANAERFAEEMAGQGAVPSDVVAVPDAKSAVADADIVCAATTSATPVFDGDDLRPGTHVNAVGSFTPQMQEVDATTIMRSLVTVDSRAAVMAEAGDLLVPLESGEITESHIHAEIGEIINGTRPGRTSPQQITYFKSVGVAVQDAVAAGIALRVAEKDDLGTLLDL